MGLGRAIHEADQASTSAKALLLEHSAHKAMTTTSIGPDHSIAHQEALSERVNIRAGADLLHDANHLVAKDQRQGESVRGSEVIGPDVEVAATDSGGVDSDHE